MSNDNFTEFKIEDKNAETTKKKLSESVGKNLSIGTDTTTVETLRTSFLSGEKKGWVVKVPLPSEYQNIPLPREQYVVTWIDIYTGRSLDKSWSEVLGTDVNVADLPKMGDSFPGGMAQSYGSLNSDTNKFVPEDFIRLSNIQSIRSKIGTESTSPGSCTITLQNPLVQKKMDDGSLLWERFHYKTGRYVEGSWVWYLAKNDPKKLWYRGKLRKANPTDSKIIKLDDAYFTVEWFKETPSDAISINDSERFFAEDLGEPLLEPMQKFKVYGINRFPYDVLQKYGYGEILKPGETNDKVEYESVAPGLNIRQLEIPPQIINSSGSLVKADTLTADNKTMYAYARPIFTGYIADVVNQQRGTEWSINITGKDVTCWLDYSRLNVNPSLNIWGQDVVAESFRTDIPIYTIRYAGMSAEDIITSLFMGGTGADVKENCYIYTSPTSNITVKKSDGQAAIIYQAQKVTIHDPNAVNGRYHVTTDSGLDGWVDESDITQSYNIYTGVGNFVITTDINLPIYGMGEDPNKLHAEMLPDKLIVNPTLEAVSDEPIYDSYRLYFRQSWPAYQSEYITRRDVVNTVCKTTNTECYADADGKVWFHPIWAYHSVLNPIFVLQKEDILSWSFTFSDREVVTWVQATGEHDFNAIAAGMLFSQAYESADMVGRFGIRGVQIKNPNLRENAACQTFARSMLRRINANIITGTVTMVLRPELQPARNVFIPWLNAIGYISTIETNIQYGSSATTTLGLKYVRRPWEAWTPIDYGLDMDTSTVNQSTSSVTSGVTHQNYGTNLQGQQVGNQATTSDTRPKSSVADSSPEKARDMARDKGYKIYDKYKKLKIDFAGWVSTISFFKSKQTTIVTDSPSVDSFDDPQNFISPYAIEFTVMFGNSPVPTKDNASAVHIIAELRLLALRYDFSLLNYNNFPYLVLEPRNQ